MNDFFMPELLQHLQDNHSAQATINALRFITAKLSFNHLDGRAEQRSRVQSLMRQEDQATSVAAQAWECAIRSNLPEPIINAAIDYYTRAVECYSDALSFYSLDPVDDASQFDHLAARAILLLNALATWKMLAYQAPDAHWAELRLHVMQLWQYQKLGRHGGSSRTTVPATPSENEKSLNLTGQLIYQSAEISKALVQALLLETAGAASLCKTEIAELIRIIWLASEHLRFRTFLPDNESALFFDAKSGKAVVGTHVTSDAPRYGGLCIAGADVDMLMERICKSRMQLKGPQRSHRIGQALMRITQNAWSAQKRNRHPRRSGGLHTLRMDHGYQSLLQTTQHTAAPGRNLHNAELLDFSAKGCALLIPKWIAGRHFSPGRLVTVSSQQTEVGQQYGTVTWMREHTQNRMMLHCGIAYFDYTPSPVMMRCARAFPSNMNLEKLFVEVLPDGQMHENRNRRILLPAGFYEAHLVLEDVMTGELATLGRLISTGPDFDLAELIPMTKAENAARNAENNMQTMPATPTLSVDWSHKLRQAYATLPKRTIPH